MKKNLLLLTVLALSSTFSFAQCSTDNLFPVKHGMTKFQALNALHLQNNITTDFDVNVNYDLWEHRDYLKNDSVFYSRVKFKYLVHQCIMGNDNSIFLSFSDDKLYEMTLRIWFDPTDFDKCLKNYQLILESLKKQFPISKKLETTNENNEQVAEGFGFYKTKENIVYYDERKKEFWCSKPKLEKIEISYEVEYEWKYNTATQKGSHTSKISSYLLEINFINLKGTKLDWRGY